MSAFKCLTLHASFIEDIAAKGGIHEARRTAMIVRNRIRRWHRLGRLSDDESTRLFAHVEAQEAALKEMEA